MESQDALQAVAEKSVRDGLMAYDRKLGGWRGPVTHLDGAPREWAGQLAQVTPPPSPTTPRRGRRRASENITTSNKLTRDVSRSEYGRPPVGLGLKSSRNSSRSNLYSTHFSVDAAHDS